MCAYSKTKIERKFSQTYQFTDTSSSAESPRMISFLPSWQLYLSYLRVGKRIVSVEENYNEIVEKKKLTTIVPT